jgi:hypothetical protein
LTCATANFGASACSRCSSAKNCRLSQRSSIHKKAPVLS